ncbi:RNA methyltransferase [Paracrocinitomix mangrovi]|uniref:TrmH family RNA methyltransferase n=1 Tax=Paracrocinitomix mangrovi TaxID=2862509 RepID=UPI001C8D3467|nr:RNA methyltransferase [Paracrocinitomix mangrovi]UKN02871.1 RNA methyltransferase [Paracrocinitomix mangrovi]
MSLSKNEIKLLKSLQQKKFRNSEQTFVVEGIKMVNELLKSEKQEITAIYHTAEYETNHPKARLISKGELERISGLKSPNAVLATVKIPDEKQLNTPNDSFVILLDNVNDPGNLGTIIRTADWFGINTVICSEDTVDCYNPKVVQSSMGAIFRQEISYLNLMDAVKKLIAAGYTILGADMDGEDLYTYNFPDKCALIMGSESHGLSDELKSHLTRITIPKFGDTESLNVAQAAGIIMSAYRMKKQ